MGDARKAALTALEKCRRADAWSDAVLGAVMDAEQLTGRDRGLAAALSYGVMQNRTLLDHEIAKFSTVKTGKIEPKVLDILRISVYQILFMDKIPASAAVNEAVRLTKELGYTRAAGFVNAVLRKVAADGDALTVAADSTAEKMSIRWSHPLWLVEYLVSAIGAEETEQFLRCDNAPVPVTAQVNTLKCTADELISALAAEGVTAEKHPWLPDCLTLQNAGGIAALDAFKQGLFYVQDAAAKTAVSAAAPQPGMKILDVCAAPGGKSFAAAILSGGGSEITACDIHENKLKRIRSGAARLGLTDIGTTACDGRVNRPEWNGKFDLVIADVPCSGLGVIRKKPDIRWKDPAEFAGLPAIQLAILRNAARYVAPGGTLLYSTCTVRSEENSDVVSAFLAENGDFLAENFTAPDGTVSVGGMLQLWPPRNGTDGFFVAKLRRNQ